MLQDPFAPTDRPSEAPAVPETLRRRAQGRLWTLHRTLEGLAQALRDVEAEAAHEREEQALVESGLRDLCRKREALRVCGPLGTLSLLLSVPADVLLTLSLRRRDRVLRRRRHARERRRRRLGRRFVDLYLRLLQARAAYRERFGEPALPELSPEARRLLQTWLGQASESDADSPSVVIHRVIGPEPDDWFRWWERRDDDP